MIVGPAQKLLVTQQLAATGASYWRWFGGFYSSGRHDLRSHH